MRAQEVKEIVFAHEGTERSAVVLKDGRVKYVQIPSDDPRIFDFMSTYGVGLPVPLDAQRSACGATLSL